jgi:uncharacterized damage-inducible protein DinB
MQQVRGVEPREFDFAVDPQSVRGRALEAAEARAQRPRAGLRDFRGHHEELTIGYNERMPDAELLDQLVEAWETNNRITLMLVENISKEGMAATLSTRGGRDVSRQLAHLHMNRLRQLVGKGGKDLAEGLIEFESKEQPSAAKLKKALTASGQALSTFIREVGSGEREKRQQKKGIAVSVAYHIAHESHHRGAILLTLKQCGHTLDKDTTYGIWDWHRR